MGLPYVGMIYINVGSKVQGFNRSRVKDGSTVQGFNFLVNLERIEPGEPLNT
jgi:hypothetical protein